jgi:hypothetical protein
MERRILIFSLLFEAGGFFEKQSGTKISNFLSLVRSWSQSYDRKLQCQRCKIHNAMGSPARFENENIFFFFKK